MALIDMPGFANEAIKDSEFSREMRFFSGAMKIAIGNDETVLEFQDGKLAAAQTKTVPDENCKIVVKGTLDHWERMLEPYPKPFYQCLQTTAVKHGLVMSTTNETYAYLPALNRLLQMMREKHNQR